MLGSGSGLGVNSTGLSELKQRLMFVLFGLIVFRIGAHVPVPGIDPAQLAQFFSKQQTTLIGLFNFFSGGALQRFSVFATGIMPYISASIIVQLFTVVSPQLAQLKKEGETGQRKINQYTRFGTLFLATFQAIGMLKWLASNSVAYIPSPVFYFTATITLVTGTMFLMWLGEQMTERGVGNGISLIIFAGIVSRMPEAIGQMFEQVREGVMQGLTLLVILCVVLLVTGFVVFVERGQRRITVNYAQRQQGRKMYQAQSSHLPLKINMAGVIPPIFASSILLLPASLGTWFGGMSQGSGSVISEWIFKLSNPQDLLHIIVYAAAIVFFAFFYTSLVFNPKETAENLKKSGAFVPGIRPGEQTARYIDGVMTRLTLVGAMYLLLVCLLPQFMMSTWHVPFYFGGTSLLIIVVVIMDFIAQVQAHLMSHQYESLMKKARLKKD